MPSNKKTPARMALEFRIWQVANTFAWDCTAADIAEVLGIDARAVANIARPKGWYEKLRRSERSKNDGGGIRPAFTSIPNAVGEETYKVIERCRQQAAEEGL